MAVAAVCHIAVLGLSGDGDNEGVGKSSLCSRFIRPEENAYIEDGEDHTSVVSLSDFQEQELNADHFLYFGSTERREGSPPWLRGNMAAENAATIKFHVVEQTEFIDDSTFTAFRHAKPYVQRAMQDKLRSNGKVSYISRSKIGHAQSPSDQREKFPAEFHKHGVDAFVFVLDPTTSNVRRRRQLDLLDDCLKKLPKKKPAVVVLTKCDTLPGSVQSKLNNDFDFVSFFGGPGACTASRDSSSLGRSGAKSSVRSYKMIRQLVCFFSSARAGLGVDEPFLYLASKSLAVLRSSPRPQSYVSLVEEHAQLISKVTADVKACMRSQVMTYTRNWVEMERRLLDDTTDTTFATYMALRGRDQCLTTFRMRLLELKIASSRASVERAAAVALGDLSDSEPSKRREALIQNETFMRTLCDHPDLFIYVKRPAMFAKALKLYDLTLPEPEKAADRHTSRPAPLPVPEPDGKGDSDTGVDEGWGEEEWDDSFVAAQARPLPPPPDDLLGDEVVPPDELDDDEGGLYDVVVDRSPLPVKLKQALDTTQPEDPYALPHDDVSHAQCAGRAHSQSEPKNSMAGRQQANANKPFTGDNMQLSSATAPWQQADNTQTAPVKSSQFYSEIGPLGASGMQEPRPYDSVSLDSGSEGPVVERPRVIELVDVEYEDVSEQVLSTPATNGEGMAKSLDKEVPYETVRPKRSLPVPPVTSEDTTNYDDMSEQSAPGLVAVEVQEPNIDDSEKVCDEDIGLYETVKPRRAVSVPAKDTNYETVKPRAARATTTTATGGPKRNAYEEVSGRRLSEEGKFCLTSQSSDEQTYMYSSVEISQVRGKPQPASIAAPTGNMRPLRLLDSQRDGKSYHRPPAVNQEPMATTPSSQSQAEKKEAFQLEPNASSSSSALPSYAVVTKPRHTEDSAAVPTPSVAATNRPNITEASSSHQKESGPTPQTAVHHPNSPLSSSPSHTVFPKTLPSGTTELAARNSRLPQSPTQSSAQAKPAGTAATRPRSATVGEAAKNAGPAQPTAKPNKPGKKPVLGKGGRKSSIEHGKASSPSAEKPKAPAQHPWWETPPSSPSQTRQSSTGNAKVEDEASARSTTNAHKPRDEQKEQLPGPHSAPQCPPPALLVKGHDVEDTEPPPPPLQRYIPRQQGSQAGGNSHLSPQKSPPVPLRQSSRGRRPPQPSNTSNIRPSTPPDTCEKVPGNQPIPNNMRKKTSPYEEITSSSQLPPPPPSLVNNLSGSQLMTLSEPTSAVGAHDDSLPPRASTISHVNKPPIRRRTVSRPQRQGSVDAQVEGQRDTNT